MEIEITNDVDFMVIGKVYFIHKRIVDRDYINKQEVKELIKLCGEKLSYFASKKHIQIHPLTKQIRQKVNKMKL